MLEIIHKAAQVAMALVVSVTCFLFAGYFVLAGFAAGGIGVILFTAGFGLALALVGVLFADLAWRFWSDLRIGGKKK